ncbi:Ypt/Rab-GAP domain of gyp1p superfamily protein [Actinidia rufa]|uniref:Ypt/Rab-GAP domain of gyp1p superfamily protein n=1 Tax=Actinidia rufa TaxID=165716 RepID=A0A7J0GNY2_9ERIC|nr:Ypt/Rab-GAP domain of gyp1p superfamily protein [Actinidia rufa]
MLRPILRIKSPWRLLQSPSLRGQDGNFRCTESSVGVESQLSNLASITQVIDPKLHQHLETLGGGDYLFAFPNAYGFVSSRILFWRFIVPLGGVIFYDFKSFVLFPIQTYLMDLGQEFEIP